MQSPLKRDVEITGLSSDSRTVRPGDLFAALPGASGDGRAHVEEAVARGAAAILAPAGSRLSLDDTLPLIEDAEPRRRLALLAARFFSAQPGIISAVTGTNGKTSVAGFVRQIWQALGLKAASLGTLGLVAPGIEEPGGLTTPDSITLHQTLDRLSRADVSHLALEASSHGLAQFRLDGVRLTAAGFTNLTRDHLDYHGSEAAYFAAKARLFRELLPADGTAVLNADDPVFEPLRDAVAARGVRILSYGRKGQDIAIERITPQSAGGRPGQLVELRLGARTHRLRLGLVGAFQVSNVACALGLVLACGGEREAVLETLSGLQGAPGRMDPIDEAADQGLACFVDYAHTPDALAHALEALRPYTAGRLVVAFGCGGDRDRGKREDMGRIAAALADHLIVTDDNPRSENPQAIRAAILDGARESKGTRNASTCTIAEIGDRGQAIAEAVAGLVPGDLLLVAGKGHEQGQIIGDRCLPFHDAAVIRAALAARRGRS